VRLRLGKGFWASRIGLFLLGSCLFFFLIGAGLFTYLSIHFSRMIDERLSGQVFGNTSRVFTAPRRIAVGQPLAASELLSYLKSVGYSDAPVEGAPGTYAASGSSVTVRPSPTSYFGGGNALRVEFAGKQIARITTLSNRESVYSADIEPELLTNLFDESREKRRLVRYEDLPPHLVKAVLAAEDARFFEHTGLDFVRIAGATWNNLRRTDRTEGASTISMQVARSYFFSPERTWKRKLAETMVALQLERRFTKEKIFELYANQIYLGNRGSFAIRGFGEGAQAYFAKDVRELTLPEAAFLAGIARAPNRYSSAERTPDRAKEARDRVVAQMVKHEFVESSVAGTAKKAPLKIVRGTLETSSAPYFVDIVKDHLLERFSEGELISQSYRIYTTLDASLQRAAAEAVEIGLQNIDKQLEKRYQRWRQQAAKKGDATPPPQAQVALVALDVHTGEIKALIGGRDYGQSQLNRVLASRQPGSAFKPFVYAAALEDAVRDIEPKVTPVTVVVDEPTTFFFEDKAYTPNNYSQQFYGPVTLRDALARSLNVATVKLAEMIGYGRVVDMCRQLGIESRLQATPAIALGAYEMTPMEVAGAYTVFASGGTRAEPVYLRSMVSSGGAIVQRNAPSTRDVLDPRVAYLVTNLLEDVVNRGTAAGVRARGFTAPAAGKTGTSHDGWFAGYTKDLVCVIWVGFDDNRELGLSGAASAAPIWAEFMKRAVMQPAYANPEAFARPAGVVADMIDPETGQLAMPNCPNPREEVFIAGTEPTEFCYRHGGRMVGGAPASWLARVFGGKHSSTPTPEEEARKEQPAGTIPPGGADSAVAAPQPSEASANSAGGKSATKPTAAAAAKKPPDGSSPPKAQTQEQPGFFRRLWSIFGGTKKEEPKKPAPAPPPAEKSKPPKSGR
jgi:penicillin-binding protein 1B